MAENLAGGDVEQDFCSSHWKDQLGKLVVMKTGGEWGGGGLRRTLK